MQLLTPFRLAKLPQLMSVALLSCVLAAPAAHAAGGKKEVKKPVAAASAKKAAAKEPVAKGKVAADAKSAKAGRVAKAEKAEKPGRGKAEKVSVAAAGKHGSKTAIAKAERAERSSGKKHLVRAGAAGGAALAAAAIAAPVEPARLSYGQMAGLHSVSDPLDLQSSVAYVIDQDTHEVLLSKNDQAVLPIASLTKLMTGLLIAQARLPMDEMITITQDDVDTEKHSSSRLRVGTTLSRSEMMHLALMSSENRAAHALGRTYPGGLAQFVQQMNAKARQLGMKDTRYVEPTGLSSSNQSSARDLALLVGVAHGEPLMREYSTSPGYEVAVGRRTLQFNNTNRLVKSDNWDIGLQKTGYISEAGRCLVMQAQVSGRKLIMVFLDSAGKFSRLADAERVRHWVEAMGPTASTTIAQRIRG
ncbi:D-alanyl-D-alanine endopeptidase [Comamonas resistens]|uniref:D-alanyl-D-alanine endopeptidase n=1 Tax=Comamonas resistens TaxID=3046670 RepID=A0ABY8SNF9_9BURK|nr:D-alanyl-D-alanine endopeptidase [Comamonas resistens]MDL5038297.1 D-alanyl-D-alanine endopeptidase [Comamonas resistens]WHS63894.1 D-alanyl-D-alanine endopeptidase [Comamonas resistens]